MRTDPAAWLIIPSTLLVALFLELFPWPAMLDHWQPPWLLLTVLFWVIHRPDSMGMSLAWISGLVLDVAFSCPLGTHALLFTLATAITLVTQRVLLALSMIQQALWVALLSLMQQALLLLMNGHASAETPMLMPLAPGLSALIAWPLINMAMMDIQRRLERLRQR